MTAMLIESAADLSALLPAAVRERVAPDMLADAPSAAALRVLASIRDESWHQHVYGVRFGWTQLLAWARSSGASPSVHVRVEIAASIAGHLDARPDLYAASWKLDGSNFAIVLDALRIAREGLAA